MLVEAGSVLVEMSFSDVLIEAGSVLVEMSFSDVLIEAGSVCELLPTAVTSEFFDICVTSKMSFKIILVWEALLAILAMIRIDTEVHVCVSLECALTQETFTT